MAGKRSKDEDYKIRQPRSKSHSSRNKSKSYQKERKNGKTTILDSILKLIAFAFVVITIMFYISVMKLDMLPGFYVIIFTMAEIIFTFFITRALIKRRKKLTVNIICLVIAIVVSVVYINAIKYITATTDFLGSMLKEVEETEEYYVIVKKDSSYSKVEELEGKKIYTFQVEEGIEEDVGNKGKFELKEGENLIQMGNELIDGKIKAILIGSTQYNMLDEEIKDFKSNTKIIYTATHKLEKVEVENKSSDKTIENGIFNVYISGIDTYGSIGNVSRSDANILATVNTNTHEVLLTSIPRDYYVTLHSKHAKDKLTHSGIYGINETVSTIEDLLDVEINYYVRVNFSTVIKLVDTLGGIDVYSDYDFTRGNYTFNKGYNHINGEEALVFSRERYSFASGDNQRVKNQQHVIEAIMKKVMNSTTILTKYTDILNSMEGSFQTNIEQNEISILVKDQIQTMASWKIKSNALKGTGSTGSTYSMGNQQLYIMLPDSTSVKNAKQQINAIMDK